MQCILCSAYTLFDSDEDQKRRNNCCGIWSALISCKFSSLNDKRYKIFVPKKYIIILIKTLISNDKEHLRLKLNVVVFLFFFYKHEKKTADLNRAHTKRCRFNFFVVVTIFRIVRAGRRLNKIILLRKNG